MNWTTIWTPNSGCCLIRFYTPVICSEFDFLANFLKLSCRSLHVNSSLSEKRDLVWCPFSAFNKNFPQCPGLICVKWLLLILEVPRSLFTPIVLKKKLLQDFCLSCSLFICLYFLYQLTKLNFLIFHLGGRQNPSSWQMSLSQIFLNKIWQNITKSSKFLWICSILFRSIQFSYPHLILVNSSDTMCQT